MENKERTREIERIEKGFEYFKRRRDSLKKKGEKYSDGGLLKFITDCIGESIRDVRSLKSSLISNRDISTYIPSTKRRKVFLTTLKRLNTLDNKIYQEVVTNNL